MPVHQAVELISVHNARNLEGLAESNGSQLVGLYLMLRVGCLSQTLATTVLGLWVYLTLPYTYIQMLGVVFCGLNTRA